MKSKRILGLDLGTNSIGWALVEENDNQRETSKIIDCGVRIVSLTSDEKDHFQKGKSFSKAQERTQKRGARRNLDRYQLRRKELLGYLKEAKIIDENFVLAENGKNTTYEIWKLRAKSATEKIDLKDLARVLFTINKKRGYKSNRRAQQDENEGQAIDGMKIAKELSNRDITVGQYVLEQLKRIKKENLSRDKKQQKKYKIPTFYRSDLQEEFNRIWNNQKTFHQELTDELKDKLEGKNKKETEKEFRTILANQFKEKWQGLWSDNKGVHPTEFTKEKLEELNKDDTKPETIIQFFDEFKLKLSASYIAEPKNEKGKKANTEEKKYQFYKWRNDALNKKLELNEVFAILVEINNQIKGSSGYLGAISDRSKELHFNDQTIGQYLYEKIKQNRHFRLKDQIFYRADYENEFDAIWDKQKEFYPNILTDELKKNIKDITIFYQRPLKSCKHLIDGCEFEKRKYKDQETGEIKEQGIKVCPKSSPLFQEFRIWQNINNLIFKNGKEKFKINQEEKNKLFKEANLKSELSKKQLFKILDYSDKEYEINFEKVEGNRTNEKIYKAFQEILEIEGYEFDFSKISANEIKNAVTEIFSSLNIDIDILNFDTDLQGDKFDKQPAYEFWHILYSIEHPEAVIKKLQKFGFNEKHAKILSRVVFEQNYGNLSSKAIKKILPYMKEEEGLRYDEACKKAGYNHSRFLTKEENDKREMDDENRLNLRNPVVEKILYQMINTVNAIIDKHGKPEEVRLEMARELKKSAKERQGATKGINAATKKHKEIKKEIEKYISTRITRNDIIKYKLWEESKTSIYTGDTIPLNKLFDGKSYEIEHIIPKALLFDDSFSNKTLCESSLNRDKGSQTAYDFLKGKYGEEKFSDYEKRVKDLFKDKKISKSKRDKLLMSQSEIPDRFIERDLRDTQYIAKKAKSLLEQVFRDVYTTTGSITDRLRNDWELTKVMKEINLKKYKALNMVTYEKSKPDKQGNTEPLEKIKDWTKRDDHRHHAVDAIITAFTKREHVQYLNSLNALNFERDKLENLEADKTNSKHYKELKMLKTFEEKFLHRKRNKNGDEKGSLRFTQPYPNFKNEVKEHLNGILISQKANNKVVTKNKNYTKGSKTPQEVLTPRGSLHKDTVYGSRLVYQTKEEKIGTTFDEDKINMVAKPSYKKALLKRLKAFGNDPKKAFGGKNSPAKNPVLDAKGQELPEKVKLVWKETQYTIRKPIDKDLKVDKVVDEKVKEILKKRLEEFANDAKTAFSNLEENPIWLNKEKGIAIKRVTIKGSNKVESLGVKKDHLGNVLKNDDGKEIPSGFVQTGNNHHIAIYEDENGNWHEEVVSFWKTVERARQKLPIIDTAKNTIEVKENITLSCKFLFSMAINDYFIFGSDDFDPMEIDLLDPKNKADISKHLFRVQKLSNKDYTFRHHLETTIKRNLENTCKRIGLPSSKNKQTHSLAKIVKVQLDRLGNIVEVLYPKQ